ncbi:hypothetical protein K2173_027327 [Erythroxylum novogranatense]|uniref:Dynein light chain n=1 Tax=Erythroxylum novogranatense TaxID=1862640 RepID=A0AAV8TYV8_9ROSI|nr:hypothetical protein K2173_027327 [Erythroxylum novogranatense]
MTHPHSQQANSMAHRTTHRRILASPEPDPSLMFPSSMDPTLKEHTSILPTTKIPDPILPSKSLSNQLSRPKAWDKTGTGPHKPTKSQPPASVDIYLQTKAMTVSADFDGSRYLGVKPKHRQHKPIESKVEQVRRVTTAKEGSIENVKKSSSRELVEKKKLPQYLVNEKKKKETFSLGKNSKEALDLLEGLDIKRITVSLGVGGRRNSFGGSHVELADFLANCGAKVVSVDMPEFMQIHAVDCARKTHDSLEKFTSKTLALTLKKEFDGVYGPAWHCIVGTSFGSFVTHSVGGFLYFSMDQKLYILLFKTTVQRAD